MDDVAISAVRRCNRDLLDLKLYQYGTLPCDLSWLLFEHVMRMAQCVSPETVNATMWSVKIFTKTETHRCIISRCLHYPPFRNNAPPVIVSGIYGGPIADATFDTFVYARGALMQWTNLIQLEYGLAKMTPDQRDEFVKDCSADYVTLITMIIEMTEKVIDDCFFDPCAYIGVTFVPHYPDRWAKIVVSEV